MPFVNGKWLHHYNCTWCVFSRRIEQPVKKGHKPTNKTWCEKHKKYVDPYLTNGEMCLEYVQDDCGCEKCMAIKAVLNGNCISHME